MRLSLIENQSKSPPLKKGGLGGFGFGLAPNLSPSISVPDTPGVGGIYCRPFQNLQRLHIVILSAAKNLAFFKDLRSFTTFRMTKKAQNENPGPTRYQSARIPKEFFKR